MKIKYFSQKPEGVLLHDGNFDSAKSTLHPCLTLLGRFVFVSSCNSGNNQLQFGQNFSKIILFAQKNPERKKFDITLNLKCSLHKPRKINEIMIPIIGLGQEI